MPAAWSSSAPEAPELVADGALALVEALGGAARRRLQLLGVPEASRARARARSPRRRADPARQSRAAASGGSPRARRGLAPGRSPRRARAVTSASASTCSARRDPLGLELPNASRYSTCVAGSVRLHALVLRGDVAELRGDFGELSRRAEPPLTYARLRPSAWTTRRTTSSRSPGCPPPRASPTRTRARLGSSKSASTSASSPRPRTNPAGPGRRGPGTRRRQPWTSRRRSRP